MHRNDVLVVLGDDSCFVSSLDGAPLGPVLSAKMRIGATAAMLPSRDVVAVAYFEGRIAAYDWRSGALIWELDGYSEVSEILCLDNDSFLILQLSGELAEIDAETGEAMGTLGGVVYAIADSTRPILVLLRAVGPRRRASKYVLELRGSLSRETAIIRRETGSRSIAGAAFGDSWLALSELQWGEILAMDLHGNELWRRAPDGEVVRFQGSGEGRDRGFQCLSRAPDSSWLFALQWPKKGGIPIEGVLIDPRDGSLIGQAALPNACWGIPVANGSALVSTSGLLSLPEMIWTPRSFGAP
ncbi:MAG TPA: PQQ-binding-like beta-propeller repeat protein [Phycisphaerales bacterium]|nr:PQQ-binding-like beta-propeller repeat protein [Phycisphaerales bacterium]